MAAAAAPARPKAKVREKEKGFDSMILGEETVGNLMLPVDVDSSFCQGRGHVCGRACGMESGRRIAPPLFRCRGTILTIYEYTSQALIVY